MLLETGEQGKQAEFRSLGKLEGALLCERHHDPDLLLQVRPRWITGISTYICESVLLCLCYVRASALHYDIWARQYMYLLLRCSLLWPLAEAALLYIAFS